MGFERQFWYCKHRFPFLGSVLPWFHNITLVCPIYGLPFYSSANVYISCSSSIGLKGLCLGMASPDVQCATHFDIQTSPRPASVGSNDACPQRGMLISGHLSDAPLNQGVNCFYGRCGVGGAQPVDADFLYIKSVTFI